METLKILAHLKTQFDKRRIQLGVDSNKAESIPKWRDRAKAAELQSCIHTIGVLEDKISNNWTIEQIILE